MKILLQNYTTKELLTPTAYQLNEMVKQLKLIPMFSLSIDFSYQKSLALDIKLCELRNTFRLLYNVATVSCMAMWQQNADTKLLDVLVVEKITNLMNVNKNQ